MILLVPKTSESQRLVSIINGLSLTGGRIEYVPRYSHIMQLTQQPIKDTRLPHPISPFDGWGPYVHKSHHTIATCSTEVSHTRP